MHAQVSANVQEMRLQWWQVHGTAVHHLGQCFPALPLRLSLILCMLEKLNGIFGCLLTGTYFYAHLHAILQQDLVLEAKQQRIHIGTIWKSFCYDIYKKKELTPYTQACTALYGQYKSLMLLRYIVRIQCTQIMAISVYIIVVCRLFGWTGGSLAIIWLIEQINFSSVCWWSLIGTLANCLAPFELSDSWSSASIGGWLTGWEDDWLAASWTERLRLADRKDVCGLKPPNRVHSGSFRNHWFQKPGWNKKMQCVTFSFSQQTLNYV